ncbi:MAG: hypothetical protein ACXWP5_05695 [Bdellovibrionota bacterium]
MWLAIALFLLPHSAQAEGLQSEAEVAPAPKGHLDLSLATGARSFPLGASIDGELGYSLQTWGASPAGSNPFYGYIRPAIGLSTSGIVTRFEPKIEFFPVSFAGISLGYIGSGRVLKVGQGFDCLSVDCKSYVGGPYANGRVGFGYAHLFVVDNFRFTAYTAASARPFVEEVSNLGGAAGGDQLLSNDLAVGGTIAERYTIGALWTRELMLQSLDGDSQESLFFRLKYGDWSYTVGAGVYESTQLPLGFTGYARVQWTPFASLSVL